jgi:hypothetical protein
VEKEFATVFAEAISTANKIGKSIEMSRLTIIQRNRQNTSASSPEEYYRRNVMIPVLDNILTDMMHRFGKNQQTAMTLDILIPSNTVKTCSVADFQSVEQSANFYASIICSEATANSCTVAVKAIHGEISNWRTMWIKRQGDNKPVPSNAIDTYVSCDQQFYPYIKRLVQILCTLPVSVATAERSFSTLRRLKTWTRSTMSEERLSGLALMHIHRDISLNCDDIISIFANSHKTRVDFVL